MFSPIIADILFVIIFFCFLAIPVTIAYIVYRDAKRHHMEAWLWTLIALLVPFFIGVIIYFVVRQSYSLNTGNICASCKNPIQENWKICPVCGADLALPGDIVTHKQPKTSKFPFYLLAFEVIFPIVILTLAMIPM